MSCFSPDHMRILFLLSLLTICLVISPCRAEEHLIERGETCLQIAIDHDLTMEQLQQLNPGIDLEMMMIGDKLILPDEGTSFDEFLARQYAQWVHADESECMITAAGAALCFLYVENISESPLFDVRLKVSVLGKNGFSADSEAEIPLIQILPGEKLPVAVTVPGNFDDIENCKITVMNLTHSDSLQSSFRIPESCYQYSTAYSADRVSGRTEIEFNAEGTSAYQGKQINVLASACDRDGNLIGVRSLFTDFYPSLQLTVYSDNREMESVDIRMEAY